MTTYGWEREEWRNAVEAAEDAGECDFDRPSRSDLAWEDDGGWTPEDDNE